MLVKLNFIISLILLCFFSNIAMSKTKINKIATQDCSLDNKNPCIKINSGFINSSKLSENSIRKTVITRNDILESGAVDIVDVLKNLPNIHISQSGSKGQQTSLFMRGSGSNHTLVLINGVAINDQSTTQGLHDFGVDFIQTIQQIEIYEGPNTTNFGANAIGGAINIITTIDYQDSLSFSSFNKDNYDFSLNKTFTTENSTSLNLKLGGVKSKTASAKFDGKEDDEMKNLSANFNLKKWINNKTKIKHSTYLRQTITEYDSSATNEEVYEGDNKMLSSQLELTNKNEENENRFLIYYNNYDREYNEQGIIDYYDSKAMGLKYDNSISILNNLSFGFGSEYRYDWGDFQNNGSYSASTKGHYDNLSIYSNLGWNIFDNTNLSIFYRNDENKIVESNESYKLNLEQKINKFKIGLTRMTGFRNPTLYELFGTDNYGYSGNKFLKSEKSNTNQIYGEFYFNKNLTFNITGFKTGIFDHIEYSNNKYINNASNVDLNQSGINNEIKFFNKNNKITFFSSFLSSKKTNGSDQLRRPEKTYGLNFDKNFENNFFGKFKLNFNYKHYGKHFDTHSENFSTIEMDSTDIVNFSLRKNLGSLQLYLNSTNLLDEIYQRPHGYSQDGRLFKIGLKTTF